MPLNKNCIGKVYPAITTEVSAQAIREYALACNEDNPIYFDTDRPGGLVAPPLFGAAATWPAMLQAASDPELGLDLTRILHTEENMEYLAPIRPGDRISSIARIANIEVLPHGETLSVEIAATNDKGVPVQNILFTGFVRLRARGQLREAMSRPDRAQRRAANALRQDEPVTVVTQSIDPDQTVRYAKASGDFNPIHLDEEVARRVGLPGIIVHGLCTMAFASKAVIDSLCARNPLRLKRMRARFSRPVFPGQVLTTKLWLEQVNGTRHVYSYVTLNPQGLPVISDGIAEVEAA